MDKKASGIGLYLVKQTLDKLGHSIQIDSELGVGTTVTIDFNQTFQ
jgi:signal transduction histidine kinase